MIGAHDVPIEEWRPDEGDATRVTAHLGAHLGADLDALADVLHAVVYDGAGVSFIVPFSRRRGARILVDKVLPGVRARTRRVRRGPNRQPDRRHRADRPRDAAEPAAPRRGPEAARPSVGLADGESLGR